MSCISLASAERGSIPRTTVARFIRGAKQASIPTDKAGISRGVKYAILFICLDHSREVRDIDEVNGRVGDGKYDFVKEE